MIEKIVYQALSTDLNIDGRIWPLFLPEKGVYPAITYQNITEIPHNHLKGASDVENSRLQIDIWAESYGEVKELFQEVKTSMNGISSLLIGTRHEYEENTKLYRVSADFSVWN